MDGPETLKLDFQSTEEYIARCDEHMFRIKNWALLTTSAVIAYSISSNSEAVVFANLVLVLAFLYLELIYKSFQDTAIDHSIDLSERIDRIIHGANSELVVEGYVFGFGRKLRYPSVSQCWSIVTNKYRRHILNFYGLIVVFSFGAYFLGRFYELPMEAT